MDPELAHLLNTISPGDLLTVFTTGGHKFVGWEARPPGWEDKILRLITEHDNDEGPCININVSAIVAIAFN